MVMALRPSGNWATPARLDALPRSHPSPLSSIYRVLSSPPLAKRRLFPDRMGFLSATGLVRVLQAGREAVSRSESRVQQVGAGARD